MGQNNSRDQWSTYDSQEFFKQQIQFYRWRADSITNTHICKVFFKLQETVRDRQKLNIFLNTKFTQNEYIPLRELMNLSNESDKQAKEELMSFETYIAQLSQLQASMPLPEVLYTLKVMFSGYQMLFNKLGRCRVDLNCCFVTLEGEVRVWINQDYKNNQLQLDSNSLVGKNSVISSQMAVIRKCIEIAETLASNHTQFLHFSRQFRSYMQRDMLQNWNFQNARKLINSYVYTYRINLPSNIKQLITKYIQIAQQSPLNSSRFESQASITSVSKDQMASTGEQFVKEKCHSNQSSKKELGRPLSYSDYSNTKKSESVIHNPIKSHSKKFSSTDLKNHVDKNKSFESPKISRSELIPFKRKDENIKQPSQIQSSSIQTLRIRKQREYTTAENKNESKLYNFSTTVGFSPNMNNSTIQMQSKEYFCTQRQNNVNSILKKTQQSKQKKKLQKKVATISKYISYYQNQSQNRVEQNTYRQIIEQQPINKTTSNSNGGIYKNTQKQKYEQQSKQNISSPSNSLDYHNHSANNSQNNFKKSFPMPYYQKSTIQQNRQKHFREKPQKNEHNKSIYSSNETQNNAISNQPCFTIKTVNKLLQNNEVSLHESNGSFMSVQNSQSSYEGVLNKMGRSVDVLNLPSNKHLTIQKKAFFANSLNRSQLLK